VDIAQAGLLRTSGRGSLSRNFSEVWYYVDNQFINEFGDATVNVAFSSPFANTKAVGGGGPGVSAVPSDPCIASYSEADVDLAKQDVENQINNLSNSYTGDDTIDDDIDRQIADLDDELRQLDSSFPFGNDPCVWEFEEGEDLFTFGSFGPFGNPEIGYDVEWSILGNGVSERLQGAIQDGVNPLDPSIQDGWVTLNTPAPSSLVPGDYSLFVSVSLLPPLDPLTGNAAGRFFYTSSEPGWEVDIEQVCRIPASGGPDVCGFNSVDRFTGDVVDTPTSFFSRVGEILRIVPAATPPDGGPVAVSAPSTLSAVVAGLLLLVRRRRARSLAAAK
jgi:uncharacterized protein (TIGR03382 family)